MNQKIVLGITALLALGACRADPPRPTVVPEARPAVRMAPGPGQAAMVGYLDPESGALTAEPAPGAEPVILTPGELEAASTSHEGIREEVGWLPDSGYGVDLQGRFRSFIISTIDSDGRSHIQCISQFGTAAAAGGSAPHAGEEEE